MTFFELQCEKKKKDDKYIKSFFLKGRELQGLIEQAYLDYLRQGKVREKFRFATAEHEYNLFFCATGMYQVNLKTGKMRQVKRRPSKVIPDEDNEHLKRYESHECILLRLTLNVSFLFHQLLLSQYKPKATCAR